jgi:hypothetical protein
MKRGSAKRPKQQPGAMIGLGRLSHEDAYWLDLSFSLTAMRIIFRGRIMD